MNYSYHLNIRDILQDLVNKAGISEAELTRKINIPTATFNKIKTGKITDPRSSTLTTIANYFGLSVDQLLGHAPIMSNSTSVVCYVPVLNMDKVLSINIEKLSYSTHETWISFLPESKIVNHKLIAIRANGDAMLPFFDINTIVVIDCNQSGESKQYVLAHIKKRGEVLLRQLLCDGSSKVLKPLNSSFDSINLTTDDHIIGVVVHSIRNYT